MHKSGALSEKKSFNPVSVTKPNNLNAIIIIIIIQVKSELCNDVKIQGRFKNH